MPTRSSMARTARSALAITAAAVLVAPLLSAGCAPRGERTGRQDRARTFETMTETARSLQQVAAIDLQRITGVAVTESGRVFVNAPRWAEEHDQSVYELFGSGTLRAWPNRWMNRWAPGAGMNPAERFICVQSVTADDAGHLWVLDPAAPSFSGPVPGGPKLVRFSLAGDEIIRTYRFSPEIAPEGSYLNDVRVDTRDNTAFITDSGLGALIILHLESGRAYRVLADHASTKADPKLVPIIGGQPWIRNGSVPQIHADGIAIERTGGMTDADTGSAPGWVYWQALTHNRLFRAPMSTLKQDPPDEAAMIASIEDLGETVVTDGMEIDAAGNLYFSALERDAIVVRAPDGSLRMLVQDPRISWPDSFAWGPDGWLYFTTARIHEGDLPQEPFGVWRVKPAGSRP